MENSAPMNCAVDICTSSPCQNAGVCIGTGTGARYICTCAGGWEGTNCETDVDECSTLNGGIPSIPGGQLSCEILQGLGCERGGCDDYAQCINSPGSFTCGGCVDLGACCVDAARSRGPTENSQYCARNVPCPVSYSYTSTTVCSASGGTGLCTGTTTSVWASTGCTGPAMAARSSLSLVVAASATSGQANVHNRLCSQAGDSGCEDALPAGTLLWAEVDPRDTNGRISADNGITNISTFTVVSAGPNNTAAGTVVSAVPAAAMFNSLPDAVSNRQRYSWAVQYTTAGVYQIFGSISSNALPQNPSFRLKAASLNLATSERRTALTQTVAGQLNTLLVVPRDRYGNTRENLYYSDTLTLALTPTAPLQGRWPSSGCPKAEDDDSLGMDQCIDVTRQDEQVVQGTAGWHSEWNETAQALQASFVITSASIFNISLSLRSGRRVPSNPSTDDDEFISGLLQSHVSVDGIQQADYSSPLQLRVVPNQYCGNSATASGCNQRRTELRQPSLTMRHDLEAGVVYAGHPAEIISWRALDVYGNIRDNIDSVDFYRWQDAQRSGACYTGDCNCHSVRTCDSITMSTSNFAIDALF